MGFYTVRTRYLEGCAGGGPQRVGALQKKLTVAVYSAILVTTSHPPRAPSARPRRAPRATKMVCPGDAVLLLAMLYEGTGGGAAWRVSTGWLDVATPVCEWHGVTCNGAGNVTAVELDGNGLYGVLPSELGLLESLESLKIGYNSNTSAGNSLSGTIPTQLGGLTGLTRLAMGVNSLTGAIPTQLGGLTGLTTLRMNWNALTGAIPTQLGGLTGLTVLDMGSNALTGAIPTQLGGLTGLDLLQLGPNSLAYPPPSEVNNLCRTLNTSCPVVEGCTPSGCERADVNGALCASALQLCGVSADCSAFELAVPSAADPTQCSACDHGAELLIVIPIAVLLLACAGLALLRRAMRKHPQHARRWLSTATIVYYHCLNITLVASMAIEWPPMMRQLGRILSLENVLLLPGLECALASSRDPSADKEHLLSLSLQLTQIVIAPILCLVLWRARMRWLCLVLIFTFLGMWRAVDRLAFILIVRSTTKTAGYDGLFGISLSFLALSSVTLLAVAFRLRYHVNVYMRGIATGDWPGVSPLELDRRLAYLTHRFASHAPNWQFALWLRQWLLLVVGSRAISVALETTVGACKDADDGVTDADEKGCEARSSATSSCNSYYDSNNFTASTMCCACGGGTLAASDAAIGTLTALPWIQLGLSLLVVAVSLLWHRRRQPYAFASRKTRSRQVCSALCCCCCCLPSRAMPWRRPMER